MGLQTATTIDYCRNIPPRPSKTVPRDHLYEEIRRVLDGSTDVVLVVGEALTGKTELLAELYRREPNTCIGIFLGSDGFFRSKDYIRLVVAEQISWILDKAQFEDDSVSDETYKRLIYRLQRHSRSDKITWLVDGITSGKSPDNSALEEILSLVPFGTREFSFVLSSDWNVAHHIKSCHRAPKVMEMVSVSPDEARNYLNDLIHDEGEIQDVRAFCQSSVGRLQIVRTLLSEGLTLTDLLDRRSNSLEALFELDWLRVPESTHRAIAMVLFSEHPVTLQDLSINLGLTPEAVEQLVHLSRILSFSGTTQGSFVAIASRAHRKFAAEKLSQLESSVRQAVIDRLMKATDGKESTRYLPIQLAKAGRHAELVEQLDPNHFVRLLEVERTLRALRSHAEFGRAAAIELGELSTEIAFSLISSVVTGLTLSVGKFEQIDALTRLDLHEMAMEIASIAPTAEERLHLLARAANGLDVKGYPISESLREQLKLLVESVDRQVLGDLGVDIACDLLAIDVKLAEDLLQELVEGSKDADDSSKQSTIRGLHDEKSGEVDAILKKSVAIPPHRIQQFWHEAARRLKRVKAERLLRNVKEEEPGFALVLCTTWLQGNPGSPDAAKVADAALDYMLANATRTPKIQDLREIARVLPNISDEKDVDQLCDRIDTQFRILGHHGTSVESVRLRMQLYRARYRGADAVTEMALIDLFVEVQALTELSTRVTCWAWMLYHLTAFEHAATLEERTDLANLTSKELQTSMSELLLSAADHFAVSKDALDALARFNPELALNFIAKLNTRQAREDAYEALVRTLATRHVESAASILKAIASIEDEKRRSVVAVRLLMLMRTRGVSDNDRRIDPIILSVLEQISIPSLHVQASVIAAAYHLDAGDSELATKMNAAAVEAWQSLNQSPSRVEIGYIAASVLSDADRTLATDWMKRSEELVASSRIASEALADAYAATVVLCIRLLPTILDPATDSTSGPFGRVRFLIKSAPTVETQLRLWSTLAVRLSIAGQNNCAKLVVEGDIVPLLAGDFQGDQWTVDALTADCAPALYLVHQSSALHRIAGITCNRFQDAARRNIARTLLQQTPHWDAYRSESDSEYALDQNTVTDIVGLISACKYDSLIFSLIDDLCRSLAADRNKFRLQRNFVLDILKSLDELVRKMLPDTDNIQHDGYAVVCHGAIQSARTKVRKDSPLEAMKEWEALYARARALPNVADRSVVTAMVGVDAHVKAESPVRNWLEAVKQDLSEIPAAHDKLDRYEWIAKIVEKKDKLAAKVLLQEAMKVTDYSVTDLYKQRRRLLDLAHIVDPQLAAELVEALDTDEARKTLLRKHLEKNNKRKALATKPDASDIDDLDDAELVNVCLENLGSLAASRINVRPIEEFKELSRRARTMSVQESMPVWEWIIENSVRKKNPGLRIADPTCVKLFEATCKASEIALGLMGRLVANSVGSELSSGTIHLGEREIFISRLTSWAAEQNGERIWISDPYFAPSDIDFVRVLSEAAPKSKFSVLTSREHMKKNRIDAPEEAFLDAWQDRFDIEPPLVDFAVVGFGPSGRHPIHDRWIVAKGAGMRLGSSINAIGLTRISEISNIESEDANAKLADLEVYFSSPPRSFGGERLSVSYFKWR